MEAFQAMSTGLQVFFWLFHVAMLALTVYLVYAFRPSASRVMATGDQDRRTVHVDEGAVQRPAGESDRVA
jgi:hypothetical protein